MAAGAQPADQEIEHDRLRRLGEIAAGIIHDLGNLVTPIVTSSHLACSHPRLPPELTEPLSIAQSAAENIGDLAERLRGLISAADCEEVPVDLSQLVQQIPALTKVKWHTEALQCGVVIAVSLDVEPVPTILAIASNLRHVLVNLVFNAVDAMPDGGQITLRQRNRPPHVVIEVEDTGAGMTDTQQARCFERGFTTKDTGAGLGLWICRDLVRQHQGDLTVKSEAGKGSIFRIVFPAAHHASSSDAVLSQELSCKANILYVDDDPLLRRTFSDLLQAMDQHVTVAASASEAVAKITSRAFDLVITDYAMPEINGVELARLLHERHPEMPVVVLTGWLTNIIPSNSTSPASTPLIVRKPLTIEKLRELLSRHVTKSN